MTPGAAPIGSRELDVFSCPLTAPCLIEASAGTGKTWTLCALYLRLLLEQALETRQVLVVTFTNAATAELRERIRGRLFDVLAYLQRAADRDDSFAARLVATCETNAAIDRRQLQTRLEAALQTFDEAAIHTIHGFCQRVLADVPFAAGLPFAVELLADDGDLLHEAVADFWRRRVTGGQLPPVVAGFLLQKRDTPASWTTLLRRRLANSRARLIWPEALDCGDDPPDAAAVDTAFGLARTQWGDDGAEARAVLLAGLSALNATSYTADAVSNGAAAWSAWLRQDGPLPAPDLEKSKVRLFSTRTLAERTKKKQTTPEHPFFHAAMALIDAVTTLHGELEQTRLRLLRRLLDEAPAALQQAKLRQGVQSFHDLLERVDAALASPAFPGLAHALRQRYPVALIDEFQDTDPLQHAIFQRIYAAPGESPAPLLRVGDPKQAIYSFRGADLHTYLAARRQAGTHNTLRHNQRSSADLIAACNALFTVNPDVFIYSDLGYEPVIAGDRQRPPLVDDSGGSTAALQLWRLPAGKDTLLTRGEAHAQVLQATATEIVRLLTAAQAGSITVGDRPLLPGDIAILVRSHTHGRQLREALRQLGVASVELSQQSVFQTADAEELHRVLGAILEPTRPALLHAALATELMGYDAAAIAALGEDESRLPQIITRFVTYRETWFRRGTSAMLRAWSEGEAVAKRLLARSDGERRMTHLLHLGELLQQAAAIDPAPAALLRWLSARRQEERSDDSAQVRLESDRNLVQVVTIHKGKGLEYGVVFCPFLWDGRRPPSPTGDGKSYHDENGLPVIDFRAENEALSIRQQLDRESDAEFMRLLYVALTRAVHRCYLVVGCYQTLVGRHLSLSEGRRSLLNWLVAGRGIGYPTWRRNELSVHAIDGAWQRFAAQAAPAVSLADLPATPPQVLAVADLPTLSLAVPAPPGEGVTDWRIGSFSSLQHGAMGDAAASDHDARLPAADVGVDGEPSLTPEAVSSDVAADDVLHFPRGAAAGDCVHALFERIDFTDRSDWPTRIADVLAAHPLSLAGVSPTESARRLPRMLQQLLADVLTTPLADGRVLSNVSRQQRLVELGFSLPVHHVSATTLNTWLREHGYEAPRLAFATLDGYLRGFIDLVFGDGSRFHLLDWKSNHLGFSAADYGQQALAAAMSVHGYHLQYLLYTVALHRYLRRRLRDYDYDRHFGQVYYLFVRGVRPGWSERLANGESAACGIFHHRPPRQAIESLDHLLAGEKAY